MTNTPLPAVSLRARNLIKLHYLALSCSAALCLPTALSAANFDIDADSLDNSAASDGSTGSWAYGGSFRIGQGGTTSGVQSTHVIPFELPTLPQGEEVTAATLSFNLQGWNNWGSNLSNLDVYGIDATQITATVLTSHYVDGANPSSNSLAVLLSDDLVTPTDITASSSSGQTIAITSDDFADFIQGLYDNGAQAGEYVFIALTHDAALSIQRYYEVSSADSTSYPVPVLSLTTAAVQQSTRTVTTTIHAEDRVMLADGTTRWNGDAGARVGNGYSSSQASAYVMPVQLPTLNAGESIQSATLTVNLDGWNNWSSTVNNVDLYGIYITNPSPVVNDSDYFVDAANPSSYPFASEISGDIAVAADTTAGTASGQNITKTSGDIGSFFQELYDGGAQAGDYAFLTLSHDAAISAQRYYVFSTADTANAPSVEFTIASGSSGGGLPSGPKLWVDASASGGGNGDESSPFNTIQAAVNAAVAGDVIVVKDGVYREQVDVETTYSASAPLTIIAEPGASPIVTGLDPITGWQGPDANGVYTVDVADKVEHLYVRDIPMPMARWPKRNDPWLPITAVDTNAETLTYDGALPPISGVTSDVADLAMVMFTEGDHRVPVQYPVSVSGGNPTTVQFSSVSNNSPTYTYFYNHPELITEPGEWALERLPNNESRLHFKPVNASDLQDTAYVNRANGFDIAHWQNSVGHVVVKGFIIKGCSNAGVYISADDVTIEDCIIYNNASEYWGTAVQGSGVYVRGALTGPTTIRRCIIAFNGTGINLHTVNNVTIDQCEVYKNNNDGTFIRGIDANSTTDNINITNSYYHNHLYLQHPDNIQFTIGNISVTMDSIFTEITGQNLMNTDGEDCSIINSLMMASSAISTQVLSGTGWVLEKNTIGWSRYSSIALTSPGTHMQENIIVGNYHSAINNDELNFTSDYNLFDYSNNWRDWIFHYNDGTFHSYDTISGLFSATGKEEHSLVADPLLTNAPLSVCEAVGFGLSSTNVLKLAGYPTPFSSFYQVGDYVEVNGDGVARQITAVGADTITISPALPEPVWRYSVVLNWGSNSDFTLDTRPGAGSPALTAGPSGSVIGSTINPTGYRAGDFNGDGLRDLPALPTSFSEIYPSDNTFSYPCAIPYDL